MGNIQRRSQRLECINDSACPIGDLDVAQRFIGEVAHVDPTLRWIGEYHMVIDHVRIRPAAVVQTSERNPQLLLLLDQVEHSSRCQRPFVDAVQWADGAGMHGEVDVHKSRLFAGRP